MSRVGISEFVKRQTAQSRYNHFEGSWEDLIALIESQWDARRTSPHNSGVLLVPMSANQLHRFFTSIVPVTEQTPLVARFAPRAEGEAPFIQVEAHGGQKAPAQCVDIILYSHETLDKDGDAPATREADYYVVSINAYANREEEPMNPMTMARNFLGMKGGTKPETPYTAEEFANAIVYWSRHARLGG